MAETQKVVKFPQYFATLTVCLSGFSLGVVLGWSSPAAEMIKDNLNLPRPNAYVTSVVSLGAASSLIVMAFTLNVVGRKPVMLILVIPYVAGWLVLAFVETIPLYCLGRLITGFCGGAYTAAVPVFISEIAHKSARGKLGIFMHLLLASGFNYACTVGSFTYLRDFSLICTVPILVFASIFVFIPETPYFYRMKHKTEKAAKSLQWYRGKKYDITEELQIIEDFVHKSEELEKQTFKEKFLNPTARRALLIGIGLLGVQQMSGKNVISLYILTIFKGSESSFEPRYCQIAAGAFDILMTASSILVIDRAGRIIVLTVSLVGMCVCHILLGVYYMFLERGKENVENFGWVPLVLLCTTGASFSLGLGPVPSVVIGELFSQEIKAKACSICFFFMWIFHFIVPFVFPALAEMIGYSYCFWIFAFNCFASVFFVNFFCIETKGKTFQEIQDILSRNG